MIRYGTASLDDPAAIIATIYFIAAIPLTAFLLVFRRLYLRSHRALQWTLALTAAPAFVVCLLAMIVYG